MKTLFDDHGKPKRVEFSVMEFAETKTKNMPDARMARRIILMYFSIVRRTILAGHEWTFPNGMKLSIRRKRKIGTHGLSRYKRDGDGEKKKVYNLRRPNEIYSVEMYGGPLSEVRYIFHASAALQRRLSNRLFNTDTIYSYKGSL